MFKCDLNYVKERLFLFSDVNDSKPIVKKIESVKDSFTDALTTWLCDLMNSLHKKIELELIEIENEGICIKYSPLEHTNVYETNEYDMKKFDKSMEDIILTF